MMDPRGNERTDRLLARLDAPIQPNVIIDCKVAPAWHDFEMHSDGERVTVTVDGAPVSPPNPAAPCGTCLGDGFVHEDDDFLDELAEKPCPDCRPPLGPDR